MGIQEALRVVPQWVLPCMIHMNPVGHDHCLKEPQHLRLTNGQVDHHMED